MPSSPGLLVWACVGGWREHRVPQRACEGQRSILCRGLSLCSFTWVPETELRLPGCTTLALSG